MRTHRNALVHAHPLHDVPTVLKRLAEAADAANSAYRALSDAEAEAELSWDMAEIETPAHPSLYHTVRALADQAYETWQAIEELGAELLAER